MVILQRQKDETVMLGDSKAVTIARIRAKRVTLEIQVVSENGPTVMFQSLDCGQQLAIGDQWRVTVIDVTADKVRLGFEGPANESVHRKEVYEALRRASNIPNATLDVMPIGASPVRIPVAIDQKIAIGSALRLQLTDIDASGARLLVRGDLIGGPEDGQDIDRAFELAMFGVLCLGTRVSVTLAKYDGTHAHFFVEAPPHMKVSVE